MRPWMIPLVEHVYPLMPETGPVFGMDLPMYEKRCIQCCKALGYVNMNISPHIFRHSGPSIDRYDGTRSLAEIQKRGFWKASSSVRRYEKHVRLLKQLSKLSVEKQAAARRAELSITSGSWVH